MGGHKKDAARVFAVVLGDRTRGNVHKLKCRKFHLSIREMTLW